jgi:hypothetical protein
MGVHHFVLVFKEVDLTWIAGTHAKKLFHGLIIGGNSFELPDFMPN